MYNVQTMKRYTVSMAREQLAELLNEADRSGAVMIERRDVQYVITARPARAAASKKKSVIETVDPAVSAGQWTWTPAAAGVRFSARRRRS